MIEDIAFALFVAFLFLTLMPWSFARDVQRNKSNDERDQPNRI